MFVFTHEEACWVKTLIDYMQKVDLPEDEAEAECVSRKAKMYYVVEGNLFRRRPNGVGLRLSVLWIPRYHLPAPWPTRVQEMRPTKRDSASREVRWQEANPSGNTSGWASGEKSCPDNYFPLERPLTTKETYHVPVTATSLRMLTRTAQCRRTPLPKVSSFVYKAWPTPAPPKASQIGRASCRERVCLYV